MLLIPQFCVKIIIKKIEEKNLEFQLVEMVKVGKKPSQPILRKN